MILDFSLRLISLFFWLSRSWIQEKKNDKDFSD